MITNCFLWRIVWLQAHYPDVVYIGSQLCTNAIYYKVAIVHF